MKFSLNQAILVGNVTKDPELRYTPNGHAVAKFGLATSRGVKNGDTWDNVATFHNIVCWSKLAEHISKDLKKGMLVTVEGRIDNRSYDKQDGTKGYVSEIVADSIYYRSPKASGTAPAKTEGEDVPPEPTEPQAGTEEVNVDDIPF